MTDENLKQGKNLPKTYPYHDAPNGRCCTNGMTDCISWGGACPDQSMEEDVEITHSSWTMVKSALSVVMSRCR